MGLYTNNSGTLSPIAGRGKAEYGASTIRKGTVNNISCAKDSTTTVAVTFDTPMPDTDYIINIDTMSQFSEVVAGTKTINGFTLYIYNNSLNDYSNQSIEYTAFKLYVDNEYNSLIEAIPEDAGSDNKLIAKNDLLDLIYPIGSVHISTSSTNPTILFGGTWQRIANGRVLVGVDENDTAFDTAKETGGSKTNSHTHKVTASGTVGNHTLTVNEMPSHTHSQYAVQYNASGDSVAGSGSSRYDFTASLATGDAGGGQPHNHSFTGTQVTSGAPSDTNNLQPYLTVYIWERTA